MSDIDRIVAHEVAAEFRALADMHAAEAADMAAWSAELEATDFAEVLRMFSDYGGGE